MAVVVAAQRPCLSQQRHDDDFRRGVVKNKAIKAANTNITNTHICMYTARAPTLACAMELFLQCKSHKFPAVWHLWVISLLVYHLYCCILLLCPRFIVMCSMPLHSFARLSTSTPAVLHAVCPVFTSVFFFYFCALWYNHLAVRSISIYSGYISGYPHEFRDMLAAYFPVIKFIFTAVRMMGAWWCGAGSAGLLLLSSLLHLCTFYTGDFAWLAILTFRLCNEVIMSEL